MATDKQVEAATIAYLKARGWDDEMIHRQRTTKAEVRSRMVDALKAAEEASE